MTAVAAPTSDQLPRWWRPAPVVAAMVLGTVLRLVFVVAGTGTQRYGFVDSESYLLVADLLPRGLWSPPGNLAASTLWRTPIYPSFVAFAGGSGNLTLVIVAQSLVGGALNVWLAHRLALAVFGGTAATVAAFVSALDPVSLAHSLLIATETLTATWVLLVALGTRIILQRLRVHGPVVLLAAGTGASGALLALTRPNLLLFAPAAALLIALAGRNRRGLVAALVVLVTAAVPVSGWIARNQQVGGAAVLTTVTGQNLVDYGLAAAAQDHGLLPAWTTDHDAVAKASAATVEASTISSPLDGSTETGATNERWTQEGGAILRAHPRGALVIAVTRAFKAIAAPGTGLLEDHMPRSLRSPLRMPLAVLGAAFLMVTYASGALGVGALVRERRWGDLALLAGVLGLALLSSVGPWLYARFRVPVFPIVAVLAGGGAALARRPTRPANSDR